MAGKPLIEQLREFVDDHWGAKLRLALRLGYNSATTIDNWFARDNIPKWQEDRVRAFMEKEKKRYE